MITRRQAFNLYLAAVLLGTPLAACKTSEQRQRDKEAATLRLHLEVNPDGSGRNTGVPVYRAEPIFVNVTREPFLTEAEVESAEVVDVLGGFALKIQFSRHGTLVLDNYTTSYKTRRMAIHTLFTEARWLAAPVITHRITNGLLVFTPDASREEAERIVRGLNNVAAELKKKGTL